MLVFNTCLSMQLCNYITVCTGYIRALYMYVVFVGCVVYAVHVTALAPLHTWTLRSVSVCVLRGRRHLRVFIVSVC
ncbi:hypothetical protein FKM82_027657 [Ascaphus truei]